MSMLYGMEMQKDTSIGVAREVFSMFSTPFEQSVRDFALHLVHGVLAHKDEIDELVSKQAFNWDFNRIAAIDIQIMRIALFELLHEPRTPAPVCINEAIDVAKLFSTSESGHFINGILDSIRKQRS